ncbi:MAG TPA: hypothetical protein V6C88_10440 [Chroococcidiopsis sp.]
MLKSAQVMLLVGFVALSGCARAPVAPSNPSSISPSSPSPIASPSPSAAVPPATNATPEAIAQSATRQADTVIIPGKSFGPVTTDTTRDDLAALYGADKLTDTNVDIGEGFTEPGTTVNAGSDRAFSVIWTDASRTKIDSIHDVGPAWRTPEGFGMGTTFAELQAKLGKFEIYGFGWDYSGTITFEGSNLSQYDGVLVLRLEPPQDVIEKERAAYEAVTGDAPFSSDNPSFAKLNPAVYDIIVYLTPPPAPSEP